MQQPSPSDGEPASDAPSRSEATPSRGRRTLSVVVPVYNEAATIENVIDRVRSVQIPGHDIELILVDDGSTDGTRDVLARHARSCKVFFHRQNRGKGAALRTGFAHVTGDVVIVQDADLEYYPEDYPALVEPIARGEARVVYGSRRLRRENRQHSGIAFFLGGVFLTAVTNLLYRTGITDEPTCYKVFDAALLADIPLVCERFEFCPEVTAKIARRGEKIVEVPIRYEPRSVTEGKKIGARDAVEATWTLLRYRFGKIDRSAPLPEFEEVEAD